MKYHLITDYGCRLQTDIKSIAIEWMDVDGNPAVWEHNPGTDVPWSPVVFKRVNKKFGCFEICAMP